MCVPQTWPTNEKVLIALDDVENASHIILS